jgi:hypothetical protein
VTILAQEATNWDGTQAVTIMENYLTTYGERISTCSTACPTALPTPPRRLIINDGRADQYPDLLHRRRFRRHSGDHRRGHRTATYMLASSTPATTRCHPLEVMTGAYDFATRAITSCPASIVTKDNAAAMLQMANRHGKQHRHLPV